MRSTTYRGPAHILSGVSLRVDKEEMVCLVGRNGAGQDHRDRRASWDFSRSGPDGSLFHDEDVTRLPPHERAKTWHRLFARGLRGFFPICR